MCMPQHTCLSTRTLSCGILIFETGITSHGLRGGRGEPYGLTDMEIIPKKSPRRVNMVLTRGSTGRLGVGVLSLVMAASACGSSADGSPGSSGAGAGGGTTLSVVASTNVYGDLVKQIAGDKAEVTSIISDPGADPHSYEANSRTQLELSKADVVIENGGGYDDFVDTMMKTANNGKATVLNVVDISGKKA